MKEAGLERFLRYDHWARHGFRLFLFDPDRTHGDYEALELHEGKEFCGGVYQVAHSSASGAELTSEISFGVAGEGDTNPEATLTVTKNFSFGPAPRGCEIACEVQLAFSAPPQKPLAIGLESVINLLAPCAEDRFFEIPSGPQNLRFSGAIAGPILRMEDGWQRVRVALHAPAARYFWVAPIETVSESEEGFERVYQGSQILSVWYPDLSAQKTWKAHLVWRVEGF